MGDVGFPLSVLVSGNFAWSAACRFARFKRRLVFEQTNHP